MLTKMIDELEKDLFFYVQVISKILKKNYWINFLKSIAERGR